MEKQAHWYLQDSRLDGRALLVAGYLARRIEGAVILDINCGTAPLMKYLPRTFSAYYGNDVNERYIEHCKESFPEGIWMHCSDKELLSS